MSGSEAAFKGKPLAHSQNPELREAALLGLTHLRCNQQECVELFQEGAARATQGRKTALIGLLNSNSTTPETLDVYKRSFEDTDASVRGVQP